MYRKLISDFVLGGVIIVLAVGIGMVVNPIIGGIIAGAPLRAGLSILLGGLHEGKSFAYGMAKGSLIAVAGSVLFLLTLVLTLPKLGLIQSFVLSSIVWLLTTAIIYTIAKRYLPVTFM